MNQFEFRVYSRRHKSLATYNLTKTKAGWHVRHIAINGDAKPDGAPFVYDNFDQDFIAYPSSIGSFLEWIWNGLDRDELTSSDAQVKLQELADWVSACERSQPEWKEWNV